MTLETILIFTFVALLVGLSKGGLGGPVPVSLTAPLLSLVMPVSQAVGIVLPLLLFADMFALYFYWNMWEWRYLRLMLPMAVAGVLIGSLLLAGLPNDILKRIIGGFTLIAVIYKLSADSLRSINYMPRSWHGWLAGGTAGLGSALANAGAPPFTAYLLLQPDMRPVSFIGTTTLFFAVVNLLKLPGFLYTNVVDVPLLLSGVWTLPLIPFGVWLGRKIVTRMNPIFFERLLLGLLFGLSLSLLV
jgi:uncharacterized protein